ncbi:MAG: ABC transporter ATP-binding protein [Myxococcales bacterium]|nr:ABC transporter ATP-binding protein [Myxococcales bacterium]
MSLALEAEGLVRRYGDRAAVDGLDLAVEAGELYGLVGPDGAGKTTTMRMLAGLLPPDAGAVRLDGEALTIGAGAARAAIGYMPQQYSLYGDLTIDENLAFFGRLFGLPRKARAERTDRLLQITRLGRFRDRRADALSGGMYKKLALACALLHQPKVLLLDEPSNGVDPVSRRELWDLLYAFVEDGMAVVLATPYMDEAARCHRVGLLNEGKLLAEGPPAELVRRFRHPTVRLTVDDRDAAEICLAPLDEVLAVSPEGAALRVVARAGADLDALVPGAEVEPVDAEFEDVFLALLRDPDSVEARP